MKKAIEEIKKQLEVKKTLPHRKEDYDYRLVKTEGWYYAYGRSIKREEIISKRIPLCDIKTWVEHKKEKEDFNKWLMSERERRCALENEF